MLLVVIVFVFSWASYNADESIPCHHIRRLDITDHQGWKIIGSVKITVLFWESFYLL